MSDEISHQAAYEVRRQARGAEPPPKERKWVKRLVVIGGVCLSIAMASVAVWIWYAVTHVRCVSAEVNAGVYTVTPKVSGEMTEQLVKEGDRVTHDQVLARIDDSRQQAALRMAQANLTVRNSDLARAEVAVKVAEAELAAAKSNVDMREAKLKAEVRQASAQEKEWEARLERLKMGALDEEVKSAEARLEAAQALLELYELEVQQSEELVEEGIDSAHILAVRKTQLATQKTVVRQAELELQRLQEGPTDEEIRAGEQVLAARRAGLDLSELGQKEVDDLRYQVAIREAEVQAAMAGVEQAKAEVQRASAEVERASEEVEMCVLRSPTTGVVTRCYEDPGEYCQQGVASMLVQEYGHGYDIDAHVRQEDVWMVERGQPVKVKVMTGRRDWIDGQVSRISFHTARKDSDADAMGGSAAQGDPVWVKISLDQDQLPKGIKHGMLARAVIKVR
jgi:multidrug resistance efflux pump